MSLERPTNQIPTSRSQEITELVFELLGASESFLDGSTFPSEPLQPVGDDSAEPWILCVEDDRDFSLALQLRFKRHGISVVRAFEGVEGVQAALARPAEAIILDYNLPNGRGDYVLRQLKANPLTKAIPVIVVSGQKRPGLEKEMLHLGAARFFAKPVRFDALLEEVQRHIAVCG